MLSVTSVDSALKTVRLIAPDTPLDIAEQIRYTDDPTDFSQSVLTDIELMGIHLPPRKFIIEDLVVEGTITIVNGYRGGGKSWFVQSMANEVSWGGKIGPWSVPTPVNSLIIDGEMPISLLQERFALMNMGRSFKDKPSSLFVYPEAYAYRIGLKRANILDAEWRNSISDIIYSNNIKFLVIDNLSSLAPGIDENDKMPFDPVNRWMLELRFHGVAIVITHHTGKGGEQRGTSAHEDHVDVSLLLGKPRGYNPSMGCKFTVKTTKDRAYVIRGETFTLQLAPNEYNGMEIVARENKEQAVKANPDLTYKEAADMGISHRTFYRGRGKNNANKN